MAIILQGLIQKRVRASVDYVNYFRNRAKERELDKLKLIWCRFKSPLSSILYRIIILWRLFGRFEDDEDDSVGGNVESMLLCGWLNIK